MFVTFNRTSMESKHGIWKLEGNAQESFNRTSMESKLRFVRSKDSDKKLLIEPVWNRNTIPSTAGFITIGF